MATNLVEICSVCTDEYDNSHRQSVSLPCGHDFCLSCLVRLRAKGKHKCPRCRRNWEKIALPILSGMEALATALESDQEDEKCDVGKKKITDDRCRKHSSPYDFWVNAKKEFYCRKCAAEDRSGVVLVVIEEAIPQIKDALDADVPEAKKRLEGDLELLDVRHASLVKIRNSVRKFSDAVRALEDNFDKEIKQVASQRTKTLNSSVELKKVEKKIPNITSPADLGVAMECKNTLKRVGAPSSIPASDLLQSLLSNIACSYEEETTSEGALSMASFVDAILKNCSVGPLAEEDLASSSSNSSYALYENHTPLKSAIKNPNSAPSYGMTTAYGARHSTHRRADRWIRYDNNTPAENNAGRGYAGNSAQCRDEPFVTYEWQFRDQHGKWIAYDNANTFFDKSNSTTSRSEEIEKAYSNKNMPYFVIENCSHSVILNFEQMVQTNIQTQFKRPIRRVVKESLKKDSVVKSVGLLFGNLNRQKQNKENNVEFTTLYEWQFLDDKEFGLLMARQTLPEMWSAPQTHHRMT